MACPDRTGEWDLTQPAEAAGRTLTAQCLSALLAEAEQRQLAKLEEGSGRSWRRGVGGGKTKRAIRLFLYRTQKRLVAFGN